VKPKPKLNQQNHRAYKYQILDLSVYGRNIIGFRSTFQAYLEDLEIYTVKSSEAQGFLLK